MADSKPSRVEIAARAAVLENATLREKVVALTEQVERLTKPLSELLAIIHRDGGHYQAAHGAEKAAADAATVWANLQLRAEAAEAELAKLREAEPVAQWRVGEWKNGSTPDGMAIIFCDAHETAISMDPMPRRQAEEIVESHNDSIASPPPSAPGAVREAAAVAGWNACRRSIYAVCEDVQNEAKRLRTSSKPGTFSEEQHARGYYAGSCYAAKSIVRGFNSMSALDDDNLRAALKPTEKNDD